MSTGVTASEKSLKANVERAMLETFVAAARATPLRAAAGGFAFDQKNTAAIKWAHDHAAELVAGVTNTTREDIRDAVEEAFTTEAGHDQLASELIDLLGDDARAGLIARTETMRASNAGQQAAWDQAVKSGLLSGNELQEWITTPDELLCPVCEPMDGETSELDGSFNVDGEDMDGPPAHPNCRCTIGLIAPRAAWFDPKTGIDTHGREDVARATHVPQTKEKRARSAESERAVAKLVGGEVIAGQHPVDVVIRNSAGKVTHAIEVKRIEGKNSKITMHKSSLARKEAFGKKYGVPWHTVAHDVRGAKAVFFHREHVGSFRTEKMTNTGAGRALFNLVRSK